jgi:exosortase A
MPPSRESLVASWRERLAMLSPAWRQGLLRVALAWAALFALFFGDWAAMADQWWNSSTYNHILLVPLILAWLVERRAGSLARIEPSGWWPGLLLFAFAAFLWVLGVFAGIATARQLGVVAMHGAALLALLGPRVGAGLAFPLAYMIFLVPIGDELVPALQMVTAEITIALVHLSGVPAVIDGVFINTPAGLFEVAEACSGVKFLIAMIAFGVLVANACFVSWRRRAAFLAACVIVPILANGIRAWGTIFAAQFVGTEVAAGFDHIVYGWIFFAIVLALVVAGGWRYFDRSVDDPVIDAGRIMASPRLGTSAARRIGGILALAGLVAMALTAQLWVRTAERLSAELPGQIFLPEVPGWRRVDYTPSIWWEPRATGANHRLLGRYADGEGREVDVFLAVYASQQDGREAGGFGEGALPPGGVWAWLAPGAPADHAASDRLLAEGRIERLAETRYRTGELLTGSNARLKLANMVDRLLLRARPTMLLILSAEERRDRPAGASIAAFRKATGPLDRWMDRIAGLR